jgi:hypothetical protein
VKAGIGLVAWAAGAVFLGRRARTVWRGERVAFLPVTARGLTLDERNYPVFVWSVITFFGGGLLAYAAQLAGWVAVQALCSLVAVAGVLGMPVAAVVRAYGVPRALVPPSRRGTPGARAETASRRARRAAGQPETHHQVALLDARPLPGDRHPFPPYYVATCADCGWMSDVVDQSEPEAERVVRSQAAQHSTVVTGPQRPVG